MTSIIKFNPLLGALDEGPLAYHLQIDEFNILLDCGWDEAFTLDKLQHLLKVCPQIDAVLLSHPDLYHLGALPYLVGQGLLTCPIYATMPVYKMGQMFMYDIYQSRKNYEEFNLFTLDDVDNTFEKITQLKYSQTVTFSGKGQGIRVIPLPAGHMIGGTIWRVVKDGDEEIIYAVDYNHKKERHLNGCSMEMFNRPSLLITDAFNATYVQERRKTRDGQLLTEILQTLRRGGNALVSVDTAGRVLELIQLLETLWRNPDSGLQTYSIALLNNVSYNVVEFAKSQMEWMSDKIIRAFEDKRNNPFYFKHIQLCHSLAEVEALSEPKVVLSSVPDLESGFSRDLFTLWCQESKNTIILTNRTTPGTLARRLIDNPDLKSLDLDIRSRVKLEGEELQEYQIKVQQENEAKEKEQAAKLEEEESDSDMSDVEEEEVHMPGEKQAQHDLVLTSAEAKSRSGFFKQAKKTYPMYPYVEEVIKWDDYGEIINPDDYNFSEVKLVDVPTQADDDQKVPEPMETQEAEDEPVEEEEVPTKCVMKTQTLSITARVLYIDFEGRSDGESMKKLLERMKPRQLILVHASNNATSALAKHCRKNSICLGEVFTPGVGEAIDATTERHIFQVKLIDSLVGQLKFSKTREMELAWIDAQIKVPEVYVKQPIPDLIKEEEGEVLTDEQKASNEKREKLLAAEAASHNADLMPSLNRLPASRTPAHQAIFFNEPKLSDFKQTLMRAGYQAEFNKGVLIVNDLIAVKKTVAGMIQLEGCVCTEYYKVRDLLYEQYAII